LTFAVVDAPGLWTAVRQRSPVLSRLGDMRIDPPLREVFTVADAVRAGLTRHQVHTRLHNGQWHRLRRGVYCLDDTWRRATAEGRHLLHAAAVLLARSSQDLVLSHGTAAVAHGVPVPAHLLDTVTVTTPPGGGRRPQRRPGLTVQVAGLDETDRRLARGLPATSPARTLADCLRLLPAVDAVAVADAGLARIRGITRAHVEAALERQAAWPLAAAAAASLSLVDPRRESGLESRSAVVMHRYGIPAPVPQVEIRDGRGRFVARVDFAWLEHGVVGEADGRVKYGDDAGRVIEAEKDRQARLEALGLIVVRWGAKHLHGEPPLLVRRLRAALAAGDGSRFTGRAA
jgi:hypothetical protein